MFLILWTLLMTPFAQAEQGPYMWGVGPVISTIVLPGDHPFNFPDQADDAGFTKTSGDVGLGVHAVMYMRATQRFGTHLWYHSGSGGYSSPNVTMEYDFVGSSANGMTLLGGFGAGFGYQRWKTGEGDEQKKLTMNTFILRAQGSVNYRTKTNCFEIGTFMNFFLPSGSVIESGDGKSEPTNFVMYPTVGLEFTGYFGDFRPPKKSKRSRRSKKKGRR
jgi:hypothetical protein